MYRMLVKPLLGMEDIYIYGSTGREFRNDVNQLLQYVTNENSSIYLQNYTIASLVECVSKVGPTPLEYCPVIFDSVTCFLATPPNSIQTSSCPR